MYVTRRPNQLGFFGIDAVIGGVASVLSSNAQAKAAKEQRKAIETQAQAQVEIAKENSPIRLVEALLADSVLAWQEELGRQATRETYVTSQVAEQETAQQRSLAVSQGTAKIGVAGAALVIGVLAVAGIALSKGGRRR